jgi:hypothetical protein
VIESVTKVVILDRLTDGGEWRALSHVFRYCCRTHVGLPADINRDWEFPIVLVGTIFYALAGINHITDKHRNKIQGFAMASDLVAAAALLMSCPAL